MIDDEYMDVVEEYTKKEKIVHALQRLEIYKQVLKEKLKASDPKTYNLPFLFFKKEELESEIEFRIRQDDALKDVVENKLCIIKDNKRIKIHTFPEMFIPISDLFFGRVRKAIWWGPRGGGKSLSAAILIFLLIIYRKSSVINIGGSSEQAKAVYNYTKTFWDLFPGMRIGLLDGDPCLRHTKFKSGIELMCLESANQAVGKHIPNIIIDESCTGRAEVDRQILRAMQGAMSEKDPIILLLSTFHHPTGLFADFWDNADRHGFTKYKWDIFDAMCACKDGLEFATQKDPKSLNFCKTKCVLSWKRDVVDESGQVNKKELVGCMGKARNARGWMTKNDVLEAKKTSGGGDVFEVEYACLRPVIGASVYHKDTIYNSFTTSIERVKGESLVIGIDWGFTQTAVVAGIAIVVDVLDEKTGLNEKVFGLGILDSCFMSHQLEHAVIQKIEDWRRGYKFSNAEIYADRSHNYCNQHLVNFGYLVRPVDFGKYKDIGVRNLNKWFASGRLKMLDTKNNRFLAKQFENLKRGGDGKVLKSNKRDETGDHGPDAAMVMALYYEFKESVEKDPNSDKLNEFFNLDQDRSNDNG